MIAPARTWSGMVSRSTARSISRPPSTRSSVQKSNHAPLRQIEAPRRRPLLDHRRHEHVAAPQELIAARDRAADRPGSAATARASSAGRCRSTRARACRCTAAADSAARGTCCRIGSTCGIAQLARIRMPPRRRCSREAPSGPSSPVFHPHGRRRCQVAAVRAERADRTCRTGTSGRAARRCIRQSARSRRCRCPRTECPRGRC